MPTPPLFNFSTSTCETPRGACPTALRRLPTQSTQTLPRGRREDSSLRPWAAKKGSLKSSLSPPARAKGGGVGWNEEKNFLLKFVFQLVKGIGRSLKSPGLRGVGGGDTPPPFNGRQGEGAPEVEGAWDKRSRPGSGGRGLHGPLGSGSCGRPPHLAHKAAAALGSHQILCVFHQGLMGRGCPCSPGPRRPLPSWGQAPLPGTTATTGEPRLGPDWWRLRQPPDFPPLTRVAPGYQQH